jgi:hypothetical protein
MRSDLIDIACEILIEKPKAIGIADGTDDEEGKQRLFWLPLSQIEIERGHGRSATVTMPEWLAQEKGLI